jgi:hypothetical protein
MSSGIQAVCWATSVTVPCWHAPHWGSVDSGHLCACLDAYRLSYEHLRRVFETTMDFLDCLKDLTKQKRAALEAP